MKLMLNKNTVGLLCLLGCTYGSDETHTDKITDESAQIDLKPKITVKESQSEIISKDETTFQNTKMQTKCVETTDKNIGADLKPEVAEKGSQSEVISKDGEVQTEENSEFTDESCFSTGVNGEFIDEDYDSMEEIIPISITGQTDRQ
jgi:hypothetical protein